MPTPSFPFRPPLRRWTVLATILAALLPPLASAAAISLSAPAGNVRLDATFPGPDSADRPRWTVRFGDKVLLEDSRLGLELAGTGELFAGARVLREDRRTADERIPVRFGKSAWANDRFSELRLVLASRTGRRVDVIFRCYDDAVALRYELPADAPADANAPAAPITITDETTSFRPAGHPTAWIQPLENYRTSHEHEVTRTDCDAIRPGELLDLPLTLQWSDGTCAAITEAALRQYAGMALARSAENPDRTELVTRLTPRPDGSKVVRPLPLRTPWRVVLIGNRLGALLESQTLYCLNDPSVIGDDSWIRPGKITFPWWNGDVFDGQPGAPILSFEMAARYIDFCARHGIPAHSLTSTEVTVTPWYRQSKPGVEPGPDTDVTRPRDGFELERIRKYAESKGVRLWTWVHQGALRGRVEEAYAAFEKMGWKGMMVDFFDHDDQETIEFAESVLAAAARHRILIHLHGVWKPTGWERTYPNLMNHEGALNLEYLKWSARCTPEHDLHMAFTRLIAGPMDYHLGGFRAVTADRFQPRNVAPNVLGTRGHMLALYVCFNNPTPMVADYPTAYENQPGFDCVLDVPTWWDETRVLDGEIGRLLVTARRKGDAWYLGVLAAKTARELRLPLSFLGAGRYTARVWRDADDVGQDPNHLTVETRALTAADTLVLPVATDGGAVVRFTPAGR